MSQKDIIKSTKWAKFNINKKQYETKYNVENKIHEYTDKSYVIDTYINNLLVRRKFNCYDELVMQVTYQDGKIHGNCDLYECNDDGTISMSGYSYNFIEGVLCSCRKYIDDILVSKYFYDNNELVEVRFYVKEVADTCELPVLATENSRDLLQYFDEKIGEFLI